VTSVYGEVHVKMADIPKKKEPDLILRDHAEIINLIETLRSRLENLIALKGNNTDPEVLEASQALDEKINEFYRVR